MRNAVDFRTVDIAVFVIANLVNLLLIGLFLSRAQGLERVESILGLVVMALALPLGAAVALMGMIGYSFSIGRPYGFITLGTYFLGLLATWYGHAGPR